MAKGCTSDVPPGVRGSVRSRLLTALSAAHAQTRLPAAKPPQRQRASYIGVSVHPSMRVCVCECARMVSLSRARACVTTGSAKPREGVKTDEGDTVMWLGAQLKVV